MEDAATEEEAVADTASESELEDFAEDAKAVDPLLQARILRRIGNRNYGGYVEDIEVVKVTRERLYRIRCDDGDVEHYTEKQVLDDVLREPGGGFYKFIPWLQKHCEQPQQEEDEDENDTPPTKKKKKKKETADDYCKICYDKTMDSVFVPCGHILACMSCAVIVDECPVCKTPCEAIRIYRA